DPRLLDSGRERLLADVEQPLRLRVDLAHAVGHRAVGDEPVERDAEVDRDQVALLGAVLGGDPVHDHRVRGEAERRREALVALRGRDAAVGADVLLGDPVELEHRDARLEVLADKRERVRDERARAGHTLDLGLRLADDHAARPSSWSSASRISWNTSSMVRSAWMPTTLPRVER